MAAELRRTGEALPKRVGRYDAFLQLGAGGMARVYLAVQQGQTGHPQLVVVKILRPEAVEDEHVLALFMDEARIATRLQHPNVIRTREVIAEPPDYLLAMDFQDGQSLLEVLRRLGRQSIPLDEHIYVLSKVLAGLSYAHELKDTNGQPFGIVHRDVSPANVLVSYTGEVKIIDFGIAKATGALAATQDGVVKGKVGYAAPEQCLGKPADPRSDIYAVGVMLWEAVAKRRRASGETWQSVLQARLDDAEPQLEEVCPDAPSALTAMARRALARDPEERYATAREFQRDLDKYLAEKKGPKVGAARIAAMLKPHFDQDRAEQQRSIQAFLNTLQGRAGASRRKMPLPGNATAPKASPEPKPATPVVEDEQTSRIPVDAALLIMSRREAENASLKKSPKAPPVLHGALPTAPAPQTAAASRDAVTAPAPPPRQEVAAAIPATRKAGVVAPPPLPGSAPTTKAARPAFPPAPAAVVPPALPAARAAAASPPALPKAPAAGASPPALPKAPASPISKGADAYGLVTVAKAAPASHPLASVADVPPPRKKARAWPAVVVSCAAVGMAAVVVLTMRKSSEHATVPETSTAAEAARATSPPTPSQVETVNVRISVDPAEAIVQLDGRVLSGNPFVATLPKDNAMHELTAYAEGCRDAKQLVHMNQDVHLLIALKRLKGYVAPVHVKRPAATQPSGSAAPSAPAAASAPTTPQPSAEPAPAASAVEPGADLHALPGESTPNPATLEVNPYTPH